ncbi:hypothetical protein PA598K_03027 [Paenibacillus sp. 598K]|uniref:class I adenylate-forming enzyme family protein n=1 Tax=Paenibacillus sp. 598K TaxID=1117987 RepID=UPI000FFA7A95|nr:class I adenylate-forming enzyme family protein [Paenibacillus sp. 598K]GBF74668.1 hypothetical protein PA598K_03027 [Paenibacillus sp. 598K]
MLLSPILPHVAKLQPQRVAMKRGDDSLTYEQLCRAVNRVAYSYRVLGLQPGDRVALLGHPSPLLAIAECAAIAVGAVPVAIFPELAPLELTLILDDAAPYAVIYDTGEPRLRSIASTLTVPCLISCSTRTDGPSLEQFIAASPELTDWHTADPDDLAIIIYTGGTTGRSKGVMHSHRAISLWAFMSPSRGGGHYPAKKALVPNQAHLTGQFILWTTLYEGGCLIYASSYPLRAEEVADIIEREQLKLLGTVGLLLHDLVHLDEERIRQLRSIESISCGGMPISEATYNKARAVLPHARLTFVYSQTESGQFISFLSVDQCFAEGKRHRLSSVGHPSHLDQWGQTPFEVQIVDEAGKPVRPGEVGEIICKSAQVMLGYWNNPEETRKALREGWLYTGDLGTMDEEGYLYVYDRKKDFLLVGGSNVYCAQVEAVLAMHPAVQEAAVVGASLPDDSEQVVAVVALREHAQLELEELSRFCAPYLASYKLPTRLELVAALDRTPAGKLDKRAIKRRVLSQG